MLSSFFRPGAVMCLATALLVLPPLAAQSLETPLRQNAAESVEVERKLSLRSASRNDRWLGLAPRDVRWAPDGSGVYFRWHATPGVDDAPEADPWYWTDRDGNVARRVVDTDEERYIPTDEIRWSPDGLQAAWSTGGTLFVWSGSQTHAAVSLAESLEP